MRKAVDTVARRVVEIGGISVIAAIALIFLFLLSVVYPLFGQPSIEQANEYAAPGSSPDNDTLYLAVEEQAEIALRVTRSGEVVFFDVANGQVIQNNNLPIAIDDQITSFQVVNETFGLLSVGL